MTVETIPRMGSQFISGSMIGTASASFTATTGSSTSPSSTSHSTTPSTTPTTSPNSTTMSFNGSTSTTRTRAKLQATYSFCISSTSTSSTSTSPTSSSFAISSNGSRLSDIPTFPSSSSSAASRSGSRSTINGNQRHRSPQAQQQRVKEYHARRRSQVSSAPSSSSIPASSQATGAGVVGKDADVEMMDASATGDEPLMPGTVENGMGGSSFAASATTTTTTTTAAPLPSTSSLQTTTSEADMTGGGFFGRLKRVFAVVAGSGSRPSMPVPPAVSASQDAQVDDEAEDDEDQEEDEKERPRSPSPALTEINDPDPEYLLNALEMQGVKVRDFAYETVPFSPDTTAPSTPTSTTTSAPSPASSSSSSTAVGSMNGFTVPRPPELFDQYEGMAEYEYKLRQRPRLYPVQGKTLRRLLDLEWITVDELGRRGEAMDLAALQAYDAREDGGYPFVTRWKVKRRRDMELRDVPDEKVVLLMPGEVVLPRSENRWGGADRPTLREREAILAARMFWCMRVDRMKRKAEVDAMLNGYGGGVKSAEGVEAQREKEGKEVERTVKEMHERWENVRRERAEEERRKAEEERRRRMEELRESGKGKGKRVLYEVQEEDEESEEQPADGVDVKRLRRTPESQDVYVDDEESQSQPQSQEPQSQQRYWGGYSSQPYAAIAMAKQYPAPLDTYDPEIYPEAREVIQSQEMSQGRPRPPPVKTTAGPPPEEETSRQGESSQRAVREEKLVAEASSLQKQHHHREQQEARERDGDETDTDTESEGEDDDDDGQGGGRGAAPADGAAATSEDGTPKRRGLTRALSRTTTFTQL